MFWSYSLILPSPVLTLEPPAASQETGVGGEATDHPLPTAISKTMSREGKDKRGPLLSCTLWSPVCWKTQTDRNTLCWDRTLELQMLSCIWNTFSTKAWRFLKCTISGYYFFFFFNLQKQCWLRTYTELGEFQSCHLLAEGPLAIHRNYLLLGVFLYEQTPPHRRENYTRKQDENTGPEVNTIPSPMRKEAKQTNKQKTQGVSNTRVSIFSVLETEVQHGKMTYPKSHRQYLW